MRKLKHNSRSTAYLAVGCLLAVLIFATLYLFHNSSAITHQNNRAIDVTPMTGTSICGQSILISPYHYNGNKGSSATAFTSGEYGLPTYGSVGTNYPKVTAGYVVPPGDDIGISAGKLNAAGVLIYFEPGDHTNLAPIQPGNNSVFIGGYLPLSGEAEIDNEGRPGTTFSSYASHVVIKYLTIANFNGTASADSFGGSIVDEYGGFGWTISYDTVGPNGDALDQPYTGYGIGVGSDSRYEYDCVTRNGEGGFNNGTAVSELKDPAPWGGPADYIIDHDEISHNAIATCQPSWGCTRGKWGDTAGVAAGLKVFWSLNGTIDYNYVHDNYGSGLWPDTNNSGLDISYNYIANNFSSAIAYEASFNANITHNTIIGNGWNPEGTSEWAGWPNGYQTSNGGGPEFVDGAIYISNSGGASNVQSGSSKYLGELRVLDNYLINNFGGIVAFQDRNRFCGEGPNGGSGTCTLNGRYSGGNQTGSPYYVQPTSFADDATVHGDSTFLTTVGGFRSNYIGASTRPARGWVVGAYDPDSGAEVPGILPANDTIASCASNTSCALTKPAMTNVSNGRRDGSPIEFETGPPGGCGMYDLIGSGAGADSGSPRKPYFDNCNWWIQDLSVSGNYFSMSANPSKIWKADSVTNCTASTGCGYMVLYANLGACTNGCFWSPYANGIDARYIISRNAHNEWHRNTYTWIGPGAWRFEAGSTGNVLTRFAWQGSPYHQDIDSIYR